MEVKKAVIPAAGLGTRFLPLAKVVAKEFLPLVATPMISYAVREAKESGVEQIIFVTSENKKDILNYFKKDLKLENFLKSQGKQEILKKLKKVQEEFAGLSFSTVQQPFPRGDGDAVLRARRHIKKEGFGVMFSDDLILNKTPALSQLKKIFATSQKPIVGLKKIPREKLFSYGVVEVEKIASRLYKIKNVVEKPSREEAPSDLAIVGRYVFPPEFFGYLEKTQPNKKGEIILAEALKLMINDGKIIYGYEFEGEWLECGNIRDWLKSNLYLCLRDPEYGPMLKEWLKKMK